MAGLSSNIGYQNQAIRTERRCIAASASHKLLTSLLHKDIDATIHTRKAIMGGICGNRFYYFGYWGRIGLPRLR
jgi:hypothetical protein